MAIHVKSNFCLAPFTQITFSPQGEAGVCPEIGGRLWDNPDTNIVKLWSDSDYEKLRQSILDNERLPVCRCWGQEEQGMQSLRRRLFVMPHLKENLVNFIEKDYKSGPRQINLITSNLCNLRCRICSAPISVTFNVEGEYYEKKNNLSNTWYVSEQKTPRHFSEQQIEEIFQLSTNLRRLEFYGGEPLLDHATLALLEKLIESGRSKNITLFYSTNGVNVPSEKHFRLWNQFKSIEFNLSFDDIGDRFTYNRHPGKWSDAMKVLDILRNHPWEIPANFYVFCTVGSINVYYLPEALAEFKRLGITCNLNNVFGPDYYKVETLPAPVKQKIHQHLSKCTEFSRQLDPIKNMLLTETKNDLWDAFKFWTKEKDAYRNESIANVMPEYYQILHDYDPDF